jgi:hypothetical protein
MNIVRGIGKVLPVFNSRHLKTSSVVEQKKKGKFSRGRIMRGRGVVAFDENHECPQHSDNKSRHHPGRHYFPS